MRCRSPLSQPGSAPVALLVGVVACLLLAPVPAHSLLIKDTWVPNGPVRAIAHSNNTVYIGGSFTHMGQLSGPAAAIDGNATPLKPFPMIVGSVRAVEPDGSGGWYVGGSFASVQGQPRNNLAHIDANGAVTSWNPNVDGQVDDIALGNGIVYIGGLFSFVGGVPRAYAAAIDAGTGLTTAWDPQSNGAVTEVEFGGSHVYLGGTFTTIRGGPRNSIAEVDAASGLPTFLFAGASAMTNMSGLEVADEKLFMGYTAFGQFYIQVFDLAAGDWLSYLITLNGPADDFAYDPATQFVVIGGSFSLVNGFARPNVASFAIATGSMYPWWIPTDGPVRTVAYGSLMTPEGQINAIVIGGTFNTVGGQPRRNIAVMNRNDPTLPTAWSPGLDGTVVHALEVADGKVYAGGDFSTFGSVARSNLAAIDATSGTLLGWNPATNGEVEALFVSGSSVYVGGEFSVVNGVTRNRAASVDAMTGVLSGFNPNVDVNGATAVLAFARNGSTLYMAGAFGTVGGVSRIGVAAVDATTGGLQAWNANVNGAVYAMGIIVPINLNPPTLILGGQFTQAGGQARNNLASINSSTGLANAWNPNPNGWVHSMVVLGTGLGGINRVYVGGGFSFIGGQPRSCLAWIDAAGAATSWVPNPNGTVYALATSGNNVVAAGAFTTIGGQPRNHIASVSLESSLPISWDPNTAGGIPAGYVYKLHRVSDTIYAGGTFLSVAGTTRPHLAAIWEQTATAVEIEPTTPEPASWALRVTPNPFRFATTIRFALPSQGNARVTLYDVAGRRVRELHDGWLPEGRHAMGWDGRDDAGQSTAAGIYFLGVRTDAGTMRSKVYRQ